MYAPQMLAAVNHAAANNGHVLFHCTIGYRTGAFPTALLGLLHEVIGSDGAMMTEAAMAARMHSMGYDARDEQTGHRFEVGTNMLFGGLDTLQFTGSVGTDGTITGAVDLRPTPSTAETPAVVPVPAPSKANGAVTNTVAIFGFAVIAVIAAMF